jgi:hypothetical protein
MSVFRKVAYIHPRHTLSRVANALQKAGLIR